MCRPWVGDGSDSPAHCVLPPTRDRSGAVSRCASSDPTHERFVHPLLAPRYPHSCVWRWLCTLPHPRRTRALQERPLSIPTAAQAPRACWRRCHPRSCTHIPGTLTHTRVCGTPRVHTQHPAAPGAHTLPHAPARPLRPAPPGHSHPPLPRVSRRARPHLLSACPAWGPISIPGARGPAAATATPSRGWGECPPRPAPPHPRTTAPGVHRTSPAHPAPRRTTAPGVHRGVRPP